jgi:hypothetical protein
MIESALQPQNESSGGGGGGIAQVGDRAGILRLLRRSLRAFMEMARTRSVRVSDWNRVGGAHRPASVGKRTPAQCRHRRPATDRTPTRCSWLRVNDLGRDARV